nr:GspH/FimT family pseudopilin [Sphingomonas bacterium]
MIVLTIIGIASAAAVLAIPDRHGRLADEAYVFANRVRAAHDAAIVAGRPIAIWVAPGGYGFDERAGGRWVAMGDAALRVAQWQEGTRATIAAAGGRERLVFDDTGLADRPVDVPLVRGRYTMHVRVAVDGGVQVDG